MPSNNKYSIAVESPRSPADQTAGPYHARLVIHESSSDVDNGSSANSTPPYSAKEDAHNGTGYVAPSPQPPGCNKDIFENYCFVEDLKEVTPPPAGRKKYKYHDRQDDPGPRRSSASSRHHHRRNSCALKFEDPVNIADK